MKRLGFIVECQRDGADQQVLKHLVGRICRDVEPVFECLRSKQHLLPECGRVARRLLTTDRCEHVFVVWDHAPPLDKEKRSCVDECTAVRAALSKEGVDRKKATLVCITHELEAWLLADSDALAALLVSENHPKRITPVRYPDRDDNPKGTLRGLFREHRGRDYLDVKHAVQIIAKIEDLARIERVQSFKHFKDRLKPFGARHPVSKARRT
jgi:uncharacterized protein DUF4276